MNRKVITHEEIAQKLNGKVLQISTPLPLGSRRSRKFQQREWFGDAVMKHYHSQIIMKVIPDPGKTLQLWNVKQPSILLLIQKLRNFIESNNTHTWAYDLCEYPTVYFGHSFSDGGKQDFFEVLAGYIYEQGGGSGVPPRV